MNFFFKLNKQNKTIIILLSLSALITIFNQTILSPAIPSIVKDFDSKVTYVQWLVTVFMLVSSIIIPLSGFLLDKFSVKKLFIVSMVSFTVGSLILALSWNLQVAIIARVLQAIGSGIIIPMTISVFMLIFEKKDRGKALGIYAAITGIGPAFGPVVSGFLIVAFNWHLIFFFIALISLITLIVLIFCVKDFKINENKNVNKIDMCSIIYEAFGFTFMLYGFSRLSSFDFSPSCFMCSAIGIVLVGFFIKRQITIDSPVLDFKLLRNKIFRRSTILSTFLYSSGMCNVIILPLLIQDACGYDASVSGLVLLPGAILCVFLGAYFGAFYDKHGVRLLVVMGSIILAVTTSLMAFSTEGSSMIFLSIVVTVRSISLLMVMQALPTWGVNALNNIQISHGNTIWISARQIVGSFFTSLMISIFWLVKNYFYDNINNLFNSNYSDTLIAVNCTFAFQAGICIVCAVLIFIKVHDLKSSE